METNREIEANRPGIIVKNPVDNTYLLTDVMVSGGKYPYIEIDRM